VVRTKRDEGYGIILCKDANKELTDDRQYTPLQYQLNKPIQPQGHDGSLSTLCKTCGLVDPLTIFHPDNLPPPTYSRGKKRIDFILISAYLLQAAEEAGYLPYHTIVTGNHRPCFLDLNGTPPPPPTYRGLISYDPRVFTKYIDILTHQIQYHRIKEKDNNLYNKAELGKWTADDTRTYNQVEKLLTEAMIHTKKEVSRKYSDTYHWSPLLSQAVGAKQYWELKLRKAKGGMIPESRLVKLVTVAGIKHNVGMTIKDVVKASRASRATL